MSEVLIVGCGYTGRRLARRLRARGHEVTGTTRDPGRATRLAEEGIRPLVLDLAEAGGARKLAGEGPEACFHLAPPVEPEGGGTAVEEVIRALRRAPLEAFVYASSTSVYGDRGGAWVDEEAVPEPDSPAGRARLQAERSVLEAGWSWDCRPRIGRIAGIYGPDRVMLDAIREGRYHIVEGLEAWTNRIHVDDLAAGLEAIWSRGRNGRVYNLADGRPHRSAEFARLVAELADLELPRLTRAEAEARYSKTRWARKAGSKRVRNRRLIDELEVELSYPSFREGVPASLREMGLEP